MRAAAALIRGCDPTEEEWDALFAAVMAPDDDDNDRLPLPFAPEAS